MGKKMSKRDGRVKRDGGRKVEMGKRHKVIYRRVKQREIKGERGNEEIWRSIE